MENKNFDRKKQRLEKFNNQVVRMRDKKALDDDSLAFIHKYLVTGAFPHSEPDGNFYSIVNGKNAIWVKGGTDVNVENGKEIEVGVPYGTLPRIIAAWISTEAFRTRSREIQLGLSLTHFLNELDLYRSGGERGDIGRVKEQLYRLANCEIGYKKVTEDDEKTIRESRRYRIIEGEQFWDWKVPNQLEIFGSYILLDKSFYEKLIEKPVPIDMRALKAIKSSALALDLYMWLTYRVSYLNEPTAISWKQVMNQLGANYKEPKYFAREAKKYLKIINTFWPELHYKTPRGRLFLSPKSRPHIEKKRW
ncbi:MAG TPA: replication protein RepA [Bacteroidales bacterium]|nr:replication protein RepA [Bacteroidales bacterium]